MSNYTRNEDSMRGVTRDGHPVTLFPDQETAVRMLLGDEPADERLVEFFNRGMGAGKSTVLASAVWTERVRLEARLSEAVGDEGV